MLTHFFLLLLIAKVSEIMPVNIVTNKNKSEYVTIITPPFALKWVCAKMQGSNRPPLYSVPECIVSYNVLICQYFFEKGHINQFAKIDLCDIFVICLAEIRKAWYNIIEKFRRRFSHEFKRNGSQLSRSSDRKTA